MDGYKAYRYFLSIKLHFTSDKYDVFEYGGRVTAKREAFERRNDRFMFEKLSRKIPKDKDLIQYFVANFAYGNETLLYNALEAESNYNEWIRRKESRTKLFNDDLCLISATDIDFDELFYFTNGNFPVILDLYMGNQIKIETLVILEKLAGLVTRWKEHGVPDMFKNEIRRISKLDKFVKFDSYRVVPIFNDFVQEIKEKV